MSPGRVVMIKTLAARGLRGGLTPEESFHLCELVDAAFAALGKAFEVGAPMPESQVLDRALVLTEEMKDVGGVTDDDLAELHGLLLTLKDGAA